MDAKETFIVGVATFIGCLLGILLYGGILGIVGAVAFVTFKAIMGL